MRPRQLPRALNALIAVTTLMMLAIAPRGQAATTIIDQAKPVGTV